MVEAPDSWTCVLVENSPVAGPIQTNLRAYLEPACACFEKPVRVRGDYSAMDIDLCLTALDGEVAELILFA